MYFIVEFEDKSMGIIPTNWIMNNTDQPSSTDFKIHNMNCCFPPTKIYSNKIVMEKKEPSPSWPIFSCRIIFQSEKFNECKMAENKLEEHSSLESANEHEKEIQLKRKHPKINFDELSSSSEPDQHKSAKIVKIKKRNHSSKEELIVPCYKYKKPSSTKAQQKMYVETDTSKTIDVNDKNEDSSSIDDKITDELLGASTIPDENFDITKTRIETEFLPNSANVEKSKDVLTISSDDATTATIIYDENVQKYDDLSDDNIENTTTNDDEGTDKFLFLTIPSDGYLNLTETITIDDENVETGNNQQSVTKGIFQKKTPFKNSSNFVFIYFLQILPFKFNRVAIIIVCILYSVFKVFIYKITIIF